MTSDSVSRSNDRGPWIRSSHSSEEGGECVEVAPSFRGVHLRDSKDTTRPGPAVGHRAWTAFLGFVAAEPRD
ncbi:MULTISPECIES: DUF397 domain-containing protein [Streptomyces]|jgi:hypothetical protein|uniref:DUF397 domain-containing protein n=1 Tax=Streptomyces TaxID=1883 RepID=UPI000592B852|nr:DUF397 domain-containing protein [Streptomyces griseoaurantiacus]